MTTTAVTTTTAAERVRSLIAASESLMNPTMVDIVDLEQGSCQGAKLQVTIVSDAAFDGLPLLKRHRLVNDCLAELLADGTIHALQLKTYTQSQYDKLQETK
jgi:stress-induced morphogen